MDITVKNIDNVTILTLKGNLLGESNAAPIQEIIINAIEEKRVNFIFDVEEMKYINSTGLSILISTLTKARKSEGELCLIKVPAQLASLLKITKLENIFPQCTTIEDALTKFKK
jgi:anti-sigma B factor antagonist